MIGDVGMRKPLNRLTKTIQQQARERKRLENERQEAIAKEQFQEQAVELGGGGSDSYVGTGWGSFKELVQAQKKKLASGQFDENRQIGNFAQLLGRNRTLG